ncbi:hypothetical protein GOP47_0015973, partial [Adiantum capillus-veneris]
FYGRPCDCFYPRAQVWVSRTEGIVSDGGEPEQQQKLPASPPSDAPLSESESLSTSSYVRRRRRRRFQIKLHHSFVFVGGSILLASGCIYFGFQKIDIGMEKGLQKFGFGRNKVDTGLEIMKGVGDVVAQVSEKGIDTKFNLITGYAHWFLPK